MDAAPSRPPGNALRTLAIGAALAVGLLLLPRLFGHRHITGDAPEFSLPVVANGSALGVDRPTLSLSDLRGQAVLLNFWATWCGYCRAEAPVVDRFAQRWRDRGVVVVGVNTDGPHEGDPHAYALAHRLTFPIVRDEAGQTSRSYEIDGLPTLVVVSRTGKVVAVKTGTADDQELDRLIQQAL
jgi:thiol-disulfide isomerase/thioredoxin